MLSLFVYLSLLFPEILPTPLWIGLPIILKVLLGLQTGYHHQQLPMSGGEKSSTA